MIFATEASCYDEPSFLEIWNHLIEVTLIDTKDTGTCRADLKMKLPTVANKIPVHMFVPTAIR